LRSLSTSCSAAFLTNALKLSRAFDALVLVVHHKGWSKQKRPRGFSGLHNNADGQIGCVRQRGELITTLEVEKMKDGPEGEVFTVSLRKITVGFYPDGKEVTTLVVDSIKEGVGHVASRDEEHDPDTNLKLLRAMIDKPVATQREWALAVGVKSHSVVSRRLLALKRDKLVREKLGKWTVTTAGRAAAA